MWTTSITIPIVNALHPGWTGAYDVGIDDTWYDAANKRIYTSGGRESETGKPPGFGYVCQQKDADHDELIAKVPTRPTRKLRFRSQNSIGITCQIALVILRMPAFLVFESQPGDIGQLLECEADLRFQTAVVRCFKEPFAIRPAGNPVRETK